MVFMPEPLKYGVQAVLKEEASAVRDLWVHTKETGFPSSMPCFSGGPSEKDKTAQVAGPLEGFQPTEHKGNTHV